MQTHIRGTQNINLSLSLASSSLYHFGYSFLHSFMYDHCLSLSYVGLLGHNYHSVIARMNAKNVYCTIKIQTVESLKVCCSVWGLLCWAVLLMALAFAVCRWQWQTYGCRREAEGGSSNHPYVKGDISDARPKHKWSHSSDLFSRSASCPPH